MAECEGACGWAGSSGSKSAVRRRVGEAKGCGCVRISLAGEVALKLDTVAAVELRRPVAALVLLLLTAAVLAARRGDRGDLGDSGLSASATPRILRIVEELWFGGECV